MKITEVIFDFDGTIADSFDLSVEIFNEISGEFGFEKITDKEIAKWKDFGFKEVVKEIKVPMLKLAKIVSRVQEKQNEKIDKVKPFLKIVEVIKELKKRGYSLGILTSNAKENVEIFLKKNKIGGIKYIYSGNNMFGKDKIIKKILKKRNLKKDQVIYVGDEVRDVEACQKVGIKVIGVTWGYNSKKGMKKANPDYLVDKPEEILALKVLGIFSIK